MLPRRRHLWPNQCPQLKTRHRRPYVGSVLESIAVSYEREAQQHDSEAEIGRRLQH